MKRLAVALAALFILVLPAVSFAASTSHITIETQGSEATSTANVTTLPATDISGVTATLNGRIEDSGEGIIEERGFEWGTSTGNYTENWTELGTWAIAPPTYTFDHTTDFTPNSTIYYRAMARNSRGWGYGAEESFIVTLTYPQPPTNATATADGLYQADVEWTMGYLATHTLVIRKIGSASANMTDGIEVYYGTSNTTVDDINLSLIDEPIYYTLWSWNAIGYSENSTVAILEGGTPMTDIANAITFGGIAIFCLGLLALSWHTRLGPLAAATGVIWLGLAVFCGINIPDGALWIVLCTMSVFIGVVAVSMPMMWREPLIPKEESDYTSIGEERDNGVPTPNPDYSNPNRRGRQRASDLKQRQINSEYRGILKHERNRRSD